jgi:hypothetical protein
LALAAVDSCTADMHKLKQARDAELQKINDFAKAAHGVPLDPGAFCLMSSEFLKAESAIIGYMEENKDWCSFRDEAIDKLKASNAKNADFRAKSCSVAETIKKIKEPAGSGPRLGDRVHR